MLEFGGGVALPAALRSCWSARCTHHGAFGHSAADRARARCTHRRRRHPIA